MRKPMFLVAAALLLAACTPGRHNQLRRDIQNWTGTHGELEIYSGDKVIRRFLKVDKISTAYASTTMFRARTVSATACSTRS